MLRNQTSTWGRHIGKVPTLVKGVLPKREFASLFICCISMKSKFNSKVGVIEYIKNILIQ